MRFDDQSPVRIHDLHSDGVRTGEYGIFIIEDAPQGEEHPVACYARQRECEGDEQFI